MSADREAVVERSAGRGRASRTVLVSLALAACALVVALTTAVGALAASGRQQVESQEIDLAGRQRRLSERIALDSELVAAGRGTPATAEELRDAAGRLRAIERGLLGGDPSLGLDGRLPGSVVALYAPDGLDLTARLEAYVDAADVVASGDPDDPATQAALAAIRAEADQARLVEDLNVAVVALSEASAAAEVEQQRWLTVGVVGVAVLSLGAVVAGGIAYRRSRGERQASEQLSRRLEGERVRFTLAFDHAPIGKALVSSAGRFIDVNEAFCAVTGRSRHDLLACTFQDITHPDDLATDEAHVQDLIDGRATSYQMEKRYITPSGEVVPVLLAVSIVRVDAGEGEDHFIAQVVDIRERQAAEEAQRAALDQQRELVARLQQLDRTKSDFVSTVSHELRTPLTTALANLEMLADGDGGPLTDQQVVMVDAAERGARRLLGLIEDLLVLSRIESGRRVGVEEQVPVDELVAQATALVAGHADQADVELVSAGGPSGVVVAGRRAELERAVVHVLENAVKFSPRGEAVVVGWGATTTQVAIRITDRGPGIRPEDRDTLFRPFSRPDAMFDDAVPGVGLGLALTAELVALNGGEVEVESAPGSGTTVLLVLPQAAVPAGTTGPPTAVVP